MLILQKAARRVCRETLLLTTTQETSPDSGDFAIGAYGDSILLPADLVIVGWEPGVTFEPLRWMEVSIRGAATVRPLILSALPAPAYDSWLAERSRGGVLALGTPEVFTDRMGTLCIATGWDLAGDYTKMVAKVAFQPHGQFTDMPGMPSEAEEAILTMALGEAMDYAGRNQDKNAARAYFASAMNLCGKLRSMQVTGTSGQPGLNRPNQFRRG